MGQTLTLAGPPPTKVELESLPSTLRPILTREGLTKEEQSEWTDMEKFANTAGVDKAAEVGFLLYIEQRRRTRAWVVGSAVVAGALGIATGYLAWGLNRR
jgi:hypothetical protein